MGLPINKQTERNTSKAKQSGNKWRRRYINRAKKEKPYVRGCPMFCVFPDSVKCKTGQYAIAKPCRETKVVSTNIVSLLFKQARAAYIRYTPLCRLHHQSLLSSLLSNPFYQFKSFLHLRALCVPAVQRRSLLSGVLVDINQRLGRSSHLHKVDNLLSQADREGNVGHTLDERQDGVAGRRGRWEGK